MSSDTESMRSERTARREGAADKLATNEAAVNGQDDRSSFRTHMTAYTDAVSRMALDSTHSVDTHGTQDRQNPQQQGAAEASATETDSAGIMQTAAEVGTQMPSMFAAGASDARETSMAAEDAQVANDPLPSPTSSTSTAVHQVPAQQEPPKSGAPNAKDFSKKRFRFTKSKSKTSAEETDATVIDPLAHFSPAERKIMEEQSYIAPERKAGFKELYRFQTRTETALNLIGIVCAIATGVAQPLMTLVFGSLTNSFVAYFSIRVNDPTADTTQVKNELFAQVNQDALYLLYIGIAVMVATWFYSYVWIMSGERTTRRIREAYLQAVLRQNCAYFDSLGPGAVTTRLVADTHLIQEAISDKVPISVSFVCESVFMNTFV